MYIVQCPSPHTLHPLPAPFHLHPELTKVRSLLWTGNPHPPPPIATRHSHTQEWATSILVDPEIRSSKNSPTACGTYVETIVQAVSSCLYIPRPVPNTCGFVWRHLQNWLQLKIFIESLRYSLLNLSAHTLKREYFVILCLHQPLVNTVEPSLVPRPNFLHAPCGLIEK